MAGRTQYKNKWQSEHKDRILILLNKGRKAEIKAAADAKGKSLNSFINEAIDAAMEPLQSVWDKPKHFQCDGKDMRSMVIDTMAKNNPPD